MLCKALAIQEKSLRAHKSQSLYMAGPRPHIPFPPDLILYVNLVAKGAPKLFKTLASRLTVLEIPYFADAYSRIVRPIDLHNF
jgi:hypothetical protein